MQKETKPITSIDIKIIQNEKTLYQKELDFLVKDTESIKILCSEILDHSSIESPESYYQVSEEEEPYFWQDLSKQLLTEFKKDILNQVKNRTELRLEEKETELKKELLTKLTENIDQHLDTDILPKLEMELATQTKKQLLSFLK